LRPTAFFIVYLGAALIVGALIAYPIYVEFGPLIDEPMYRFVTRGGMLIAFLGSPFFLRYLKLNNPQSLGYGQSRRRFIRSLLVGLLAGIIIMLLLVGALLALNVRVVKPDWVFSWADLALTALSALGGGCIIALIEETFFRGAMFTAVERQAGLWSAAIIPSLLYAAVHFIKTRYDLPPDQAHWYSGLIVLGHCFEQFANPSTILDSFLALFAAGVFLALVRASMGHIAACIGLHTGWVLVIKLTKDITQADSAANLSFLIGDYDNITGYLALVLISALAAVYYFLTLRGRPHTTHESR
jgi:membrane protease YdiL (CAAX protease family)